MTIEVDVLRASLRFAHGVRAPGEVRDVLVRGGVGFTDALDGIWAPVAHRYPNLVAALHAEVVGLAFIDDFVAYLYAPEDEGILWGAAPTQFGPDDVVPGLGEPLPPPVHELARVHASLCGWDVGLYLDDFSVPRYGARVRADYAGEDPADYGPDDVFTRALAGEFDGWVRVFRCDSAAEVYHLDLADRDADGVPRVGLAGMNGTSERPGGPFRELVDEIVPATVFDL